MPRHLSKPDPRGAYQRNRILAAIEQEPMTAQELADKLHLTRDGINIHLKVLKAETPRRLHVQEWLYNPKGGRPAPKYSIGDSPDAVYVPARAPTRHLAIDTNKTRILRLIGERPMTILQLAAAMSMSHQWTRHMVHELREDKRAHVAAWQRQTAGIAPMYGAGRGKDKPKPEISSYQAYKRRMDRIKRDPELKDNYRAKLAARRIRDSVKSMPKQTWLSTLGV